MSQWTQNRRGSTHRTPSTSGRQAFADVCLKIVDYSLAGVIFVGPHIFGGRHLLGRFVILSLCVAAAIAWCARQLALDKPCWIRTSSFGIFLTAIAWVTFQLTPLPLAWIKSLAPAHVELLPLWSGSNSSISLGVWQTLSLSPEDTRLALATLIAYALLFLTAVQRLETFADVQRITRWVAVSTVIVAGLGIVQFFTANGKFFWFYEHPYAATTGDLKAGFTSRNHCAHFLVLGLANLVAWVTLSRHQERTPRRPKPPKHGFGREETGNRRYYLNLVLLAAATLLAFAILATLSRGGTLALATVLGVLAAIYARAGLLNFNHFLAAAVLIFVIIGALSFSGSYDALSRRLDSLSTASLEKIDTHSGRRKIWSANVDAFQASPLTGWGAGSHRYVYPVFIGESTTTEYTHAENGYLQIASEHGLPGLILLGAAMLASGWWCLRTVISNQDDRPTQIVAGGIAAALAASAVHSIVDFVWFIPACMAVTVLLAACALRLAQLSGESARKSYSQQPLTQLSRFNLTFAVSLAGLWALLAAYPAALTSLKWDAYLRADQAVQVIAAVNPQARETQLEVITESEALNGAALWENLVTVVREYPQNARAHARLASVLLSRFEELQLVGDNAMTIGQIREAADASHFESPQALREWLTTAFGNNSKLLYLAHHHAHQAVRLCPLQGEAYLCLTELAFLEGLGQRGYETYADQALRVSPDNSQVLFTFGKNALIAGDLDKSLQLCTRAFAGSGKHQFEIVRIMSQQFDAAEFLSRFHPDWRTLEYIWTSYKQTGSLDDLQSILPYAAACAEQQTPKLPAYRAGKVWHDLSCMQWEMNEPRLALESLQLAYTTFPESVITRRQLGKCLMHFKQFEAAESHLRWCAQQYPDNVAYRAELQQATRAKMQRLASQTHSTVR